MSNPPTPPNNSNPDSSGETLKKFILQLLSNPTLFEYAYLHPRIGNIIIASVLSFFGLSVYQFINPQNSLNANSNFLTKVCESYGDQLFPGMNETIINTSWIPNENDENDEKKDENSTKRNIKNEVPTFTCQYKVKKGDAILPETQEASMISRLHSKDNVTINSLNICKSFEEKVQERVETEKEDESIGVPSVSESNSNKENEQLPFSCTYQTLKDNKASGSMNFNIGVKPLFTDLINTSYQEEKINMKEACKDKEIIKQMKTEATNAKDYNEANGDKIEPGIPLLLDSKKDVYPVFRWVCSYSIKRFQEKGSEFRGRSAYNLDLNLDPYCENKAKKEQTQQIKPTHHDYNNPYSLYCTNPKSAQ